MSAKTLLAASVVGRRKFTRVVGLVMMKEQHKLLQNLLGCKMNKEKKITGSLQLPSSHKGPKPRNISDSLTDAVKFLNLNSVKMCGH